MIWARLDEVALVEGWFPLQRLLGRCSLCQNKNCEAQLYIQLIEGATNFKDPDMKMESRHTNIEPIQNQSEMYCPRPQPEVKKSEM